MALERGYLDDSGKTWRVLVQTWEWNGLLGGATLFNRNVPSAPLLPSSVRMRYVNAYLKSNPDVRRRFFVGNRIALRFGIQGSALQGLQINTEDTTGNGYLEWVVSSVRGELRQLQV